MPRQIENFEIHAEKGEGKMSDRQEFEQIGTLEAKQKQAEWEAQTGNPHFQARQKEDRWTKQARKLLDSITLKTLADALMAEYLKGFEDGIATERKKHE